MDMNENYLERQEEIDSRNPEMFFISYCKKCGCRFTSRPGIIEKICTCDEDIITESKLEDNE